MIKMHLFEGLYGQRYKLFGVKYLKSIFFCQIHVRKYSKVFISFFKEFALMGDLQSWIREKVLREFELEVGRNARF